MVLKKDANLLFHFLANVRPPFYFHGHVNAGSGSSCHLRGGSGAKGTQGITAVRLGDWALARGNRWNQEDTFRTSTKPSDVPKKVLLPGERVAAKCKIDPAAWSVPQ